MVEGCTEGSKLGDFERTPLRIFDSILLGLDNDASVALNGGMFDSETLGKVEWVVLGLCEGISFVDPDNV